MSPTLLAACLAIQSVLSAPDPVPSAQAPQPAIPAIADSVVVSAALVDLPLSRVTDSVGIIPRAALEQRQIETVADALASVPGVSVAVSGGRGSVTSIFTRGGESDYTLVLVDGVPLNEFGGNISLAHLSPANVDRIEVVRGPQSALYGGGAIAGVVNVISAEGGRGYAGGAFESGSEALRRGSVDARGRLGAWSVGAGADLIETEGFTGTSASGEPVTNDDYRRVELSASASRRLGTAARLRATIRWNDNERGFPGAYGSDPGGTFGGIDTVSRGENTQTLASTAFDVVRGRIAHRASGSWMRLDSTFVSAFGPSDSGTHRASLRYVADIAMPWGGVSAGLDIARESGESSYIVNRLEAPIPVERTNAGYFAEARAALGSRLLVTAGARLDQLHRHALEGDASPFGARPDIDASTTWSFNPRASALLRLTPEGARHDTRLRTGVATGIRPPGAFELGFTDNPGLAPERNTSVEVGLEQTLGPATLTATAFWNRYDDLIITVGQSLAGASRYQSDNLSNSRARGVELAASLHGTGALDGLAVSAGYTWLRTRILAADGAEVTGLAPFEVGDPLLRRPVHQAFVNASFTRGALTTFASVDARGAALDIDPSFGLFGGLYDADGYTTADAGVSWRFGTLLTIFGRVTNLFDRAHEDILGFPAPGRRIAGGVRIAAGR